MREMKIIFQKEGVYLELVDDTGAKLIISRDSVIWAKIKRKFSNKWKKS